MDFHSFKRNFGFAFFVAFILFQNCISPVCAISNSENTFADSVTVNAFRAPSFNWINLVRIDFQNTLSERVERNQIKYLACQKPSENQVLPSLSERQKEIDLILAKIAESYVGKYTIGDTELDSCEIKASSIQEIKTILQEPGQIWQWSNQEIQQFINFISQNNHKFYLYRLTFEIHDTYSEIRNSFDMPVLIYFDSDPSKDEVYLAQTCFNKAY
ncbi:MAG: hypothetical protein HQM10_02270 [Candidatus Riflebacteria bacterium]|nr:hypothetical protein [Candidatus Riflebacteria bacterium]